MTQVYVLEEWQEDTMKVHSIFADRLTADEMCDRLNTEGQNWNDPEYEVTGPWEVRD